MKILEAWRKKEPFEIIHHVVVVEAPLNVVISKLASWFDNDWRSSSKLIYKGLSSDGLRVGSKFSGSFKIFWPINWQAEITQFDVKGSLQSSVSGFFKGTESIVMEERFNGIKVDYNFNYEIQGPLNQILWSMHLEDRFTIQAHKSLEVFKVFCEKAK